MKSNHYVKLQYMQSLCWSCNLWVCNVIFILFKGNDNLICFKNLKAALRSDQNWMNDIAWLIQWWTTCIYTLHLLCHVCQLLYNLCFFSVILQHQIWKHSWAIGGNQLFILIFGSWYFPRSSFVDIVLWQIVAVESGPMSCNFCYTSRNGARQGACTSRLAWKIVG